MNSLIFSRIGLVWFLLVAATAASWEMGHGVGFEDIRHASIAIIVVAFVKVRFVILDFMEIRHAPIWMRIVGETWCVVVCSVLVVLYWQGVSKVIT
jgi:Prokaryotic Cytochrome C oxidase subunit IV